MYKKAARHRKHLHRQQIIDELTEMENKNLKAYWQLFKKLKETSDNDEQADYISEQEWMEHYKKSPGQQTDHER